MLRVYFARGDEFLYRVDGYRVVDRAARAGVFAALVAYRAAHRREGVILLYKLERLVVSALAGHFDVALNCNVRRAGGLAGRGACVVALDLAILAVVVVPVLPAPVECLVRQSDGGVFHRALTGAQLLTELCRACRACLDALAAGNAVFGRNARTVGGGGAVGVVEKLRAAQTEARADGAVADSEYLVRAVAVCYLVHVAVFLASLEQRNDLVVACFFHVLAGLPKVLRIVAEKDADVILKLAAALAARNHRLAALAGCNGKLVALLIALEPI